MRSTDAGADGTCGLMTPLRRGQKNPAPLNLQVIDQRDTLNTL